MQPCGGEACSQTSYKIAVGDPRLYLEVMPSGLKLWRWKYIIGDRENRYAVRVYPDLLLTAAREEVAPKLVKIGTVPCFS